MLRAISVEFGLVVEGRTRAELNDQLNEFLLEMKREGRRVLLIIDEAQNLAPDALEEVRLLSNLETSTSKLIQILLFGQPELDEKLDSKGLRQLRQRISVRWRLTPLTSTETREYVRHRLRVAADAECDLFTDRALREVRRRARGIPRLVNLLCDRALLAGFADGVRKLGPNHVHRAAREILSSRRKLNVRRSLLRWAVAGAVLMGVAAMGTLAWQRSADGTNETTSANRSVEHAG